MGRFAPNINRVRVSRQSLSIVNCQLSIKSPAVHCQLSIVNCQLKKPSRRKAHFILLCRDDLVLSDVEDGFAVNLQGNGSVERYLDAVADEGFDDVCLVYVLALEN